MTPNHNDELRRIKHYLSNPEGEHLMNELADEWDKSHMFSTDPLQLAYNCGQRDAFYFLKLLQSGELIQ